MALQNSKEHLFVISKSGMNGWYLYSVEKCSFGKRINWTQQLKNAIVFTSEQKVEMFKEKVLKNILVDIHVPVKKP